MCHTFSQARGEIMHEFSVLEYNVRSYLAHFLALQPERTLDRYRKQFELFLQFFAPNRLYGIPRSCEIQMYSGWMRS
jgi:hypothetical protein